MANISVVIPVYNKEKYILHTLESVLNQDYVDFEVIIVNDGSTDDSEQVIQQFNDPRIQYFTQKNKGVSATRNFAISKVNTPLIALLDADDCWSPSYLSRIMSLVKAFPKEFVFSCAVEIETLTGFKCSSYSVPLLKPNEVRVVDYFSSSYTYSILHSSSTVFRKNILKKTGNYNVVFDSGEDTDFWIRIGLNYQIVFLNTYLAQRKLSQKSLSQKSKFIGTKPDFSQYLVEEKQNPSLKKFLDLNRFSLVVRARLLGNKDSFQENTAQIEWSNLNKKQQFILKCPKFILRKLITTKFILEKCGVYFTIFK